MWLKLSYIIHYGTRQCIRRRSKDNNTHFSTEKVVSCPCYLVLNGEHVLNVLVTRSPLMVIRVMKWRSVGSLICCAMAAVVSSSLMSPVSLRCLCRCLCSRTSRALSAHGQYTHSRCGATQGNIFGAQCDSACFLVYTGQRSLCPAQGAAALLRYFTPVLCGLGVSFHTKLRIILGIRSSVHSGSQPSCFCKCMQTLCNRQVHRNFFVLFI